MKIYVDKENIDFITACLDECNVFDYIADELQYKDKLKVEVPVSIAIKLQNQKAIECLKEVRKELISNGQDVMLGTGIIAVRLYTINEIIDNKIKELEGKDETIN